MVQAKAIRQELTVWKVKVEKRKSCSCPWKVIEIVTMWGLLFLGGLGEGRRPACLKGANDTKTVQKNLIDCPTGLNSLCHRGPRQWRSTVQYCRNAKAVVPHKTCYVTHSAQGLHSFPHCLHSTRAALSSSEHALGVELPGLWLISHLRDATPIRASHSLSTPRPLFPPHQVQLT